MQMGKENRNQRCQCLFTAGAAYKLKAIHTNLDKPFHQSYHYVLPYWRTAVTGTRNSQTPIQETQPPCTSSSLHRQPTNHHRPSENPAKRHRPHDPDNQHQPRMSATNQRWPRAPTTNQCRPRASATNQRRPRASSTNHKRLRRCGTSWWTSSGETLWWESRWARKLCEVL